MEMLLAGSFAGLNREKKATNEKCIMQAEKMVFPKRSK